MHIRKIIFPMRMVKYWKKLPKEVVKSPSVEDFKTVGHGPWQSVVISPALSWGLGMMATGGAFQPCLFHGYGDGLQESLSRFGH